jgi:hypothetical protein
MNFDIEKGFRISEDGSVKAALLSGHCNAFIADLYANGIFEIWDGEKPS